MPDPVGVSGPGPLSQRTDMQPMSAPTGMPYGDNKALMDMQRAAGMADTTQMPTAPPPTPLSAPTEHPDQPVTAGAAAGPGSGPEALRPGAVGMPNPGGPVSQALARAAASDNSGIFAQLLTIAQQKGL